MPSEAEIMQLYCTDCLDRDVCVITKSSCKKMGDLFIERKNINNGRTVMSNSTPKNVTPKTVVEQAKMSGDVTDAPNEETVKATVPNQATEPKASDLKTGEDVKPTFVQRLKSMTQKLTENKKAMAALGVTAAVVALAIKSSRKAVAAEPLDVTDTTINGVGEDDVTPSDDSNDDSN